MGHGSVADEIKRSARRARAARALDRRGGRAVPLLHRRRASASWAPRRRWRSRPRSARTSRWRSTSARRSTSTATTPRARPSARTAGSTAASRGSASTRPTASCSSASSRAGSTRTCARESPGGWPRAAWTASPSAARSAGEGADARGGGAGAARACRTSCRATCWGSATSTTSSTRWRRHRQLRLRDADAARPPRHRAGPRPRERWRLDLAKARHGESREPIAEGCPCPACREHTRGYLHYLVRARAHRRAAADDAQPHVHGAADGGHPGRDGGRRSPSTPPRCARAKPSATAVASAICSLEEAREPVGLRLHVVTRPLVWTRRCCRRRQQPSADRGDQQIQRRAAPRNVPPSSAPARARSRGAGLRRAAVARRAAARSRPGGRRCGASASPLRARSAWPRSPRRRRSSGVACSRGAARRRVASVPRRVAPAVERLRHLQRRAVAALRVARQAPAAIARSSSARHLGAVRVIGSTARSAA